MFSELKNEGNTATGGRRMRKEQRVERMRDREEGIEKIVANVLGSPVLT